MKNRQFILVKRPVGIPDDSIYSFIENDIPKLQDGEVLVRAQYLSVDPYMRSRMNGVKHYAEPFKLNEALKGRAVGTVIESKDQLFNVGDVVAGIFDWADYSVVPGNILRNINAEQAPITTALHINGIPGLTAYFGLLDIGKPKEGETVVISGAAGAVGTIVGQIAKIFGCHVVGIAGSKEKTDYLINELGFDAAINYKNKSTNEIRQELENCCSNGIDIYFDNVGGEITDAAFSLMNFHSRVVLCGQIAHYNATEVELGPRFLSTFLRRSVLLKGFIVSEYQERFEVANEHLSKWLQEEKIKYKENIVVGLENAPDAFRGLFRGDNLGKQLVKLDV